MLLCAFILLSSPAHSIQAQSWGQGPPPRRSVTTSDGKPRALEEVGIDQRLNEQLPLDTVFRDENGETVRLGDYFGKKPVVLAFVYYSCPMLCNQVLNGLASGLDVLDRFSIGKEFDVVTISFDPQETPDLARQKKETYLNWYKRDGAAQGWHFLTGDNDSIKQVTSSAGFHYKWDEATKQFIHASGIMMATSDGRLARYFYGIEYAPRDLRLGLVEASEGKIGSPVDQLLLYCYHYDPASGKYGAVVINMIRAGGALTLIALLAMFVVFKRRGNHARSVSQGGAV